MTDHTKNIDHFARHLALLGKSRSTISSYTAAIRLYFNMGYCWTFEDACRWKESEMGTKSPATVNLRIAALSAYGEFMKTKWRLLPVRNRVQQYVEHQLTESGYKRLISCLLEQEMYRWYAIVKLLACTGLRISEARQVTLADIRTGYCDVCGKGAKYRRVFFPGRLRKDILAVHDIEGPLIPFSDGCVRKRLHVFADRCRIDRKALHPHEFRAFFARCVYDRCRDLKFVQDLLGHADIKTTARYLRKTSKGVSRRLSRIVTW